jgi:uncharacterized repeat protein (TIGR03803 family)
MLRQRFSLPARQFRMILALLAVLVSTASAQPKFKVLHAFSYTEGDGPWDNLVWGNAGGLYGTTTAGGTYGYGAVFQLSPGHNGEWTEATIHDFDINGEGGYGPDGGLVFDATGNLYGTTEWGGANGLGTVFELIPGSTGWTYTVLYTFCSKPNCRDGATPYGSLVIDGAGELYGTAGAAFELKPGSNGWTEGVLYGFRSNRGGTTALAGPILDRAGNLYGTTEKGGTACPPSGCGTVYKLEPGLGGWKHTILHNFGSFQYDGEGASVGQLALDGAGNLYGTTFAGGKNTCSTGCGTVFRLTPESNGRWRETILYNFRNGASGNGPGAGVVVDKAGNLYGTTLYGGGQCRCGIVYKLAPPVKGHWKYTVLHTFAGTDGAQPDANLILDDKGNLYGTTPGGGSSGSGVVFEVTP